MARAERVSVSVPARLHFGFVDLNGGLGRRFGSLGVGLEAPLTRVTLTRAPQLQISGHDADRARRYLATVTEHYGLDELWSEDFQHDRLYGSVRCVNPFAR